jgi:hypothetical protein
MSADPARRTGDDLVLSAGAAVAVLLVLPVIVVAGTFSFWMAPATLLAAFMVYYRRDSSHALAALGAIALMWVAADPGSLSPWSLPVAVLMLVVHTCLALQTTAPPGADLGRAVRTRWLNRAAVVGLLTALVYLLAVVLQNLHRSDAEIVLAATFALLGCLILLLRRETLDA